jgi:hypothetical protein
VKLTDTPEMRLAVVGFSTVLIVACAVNVIAALKIWRFLSIPYILLDLIRLMVLFNCHVILCMIFKKQLNLGVLIAVSCIGGFILLFLGYVWSCSIAFFQIVGVVNSKSYKKLASIGSPPPDKLQRNITISTIAPSIKTSMSDIKFDKSLPPPDIYVSDFSGFHRKPNIKM